MNVGPEVSALHRAIVTAAVKAAVGERAVIREIVEVPGGPSWALRVQGLHHGVRTFWNRWTGRRPNGGPTADETQD